AAASDQLSGQRARRGKHESDVADRRRKIVEALKGDRPFEDSWWPFALAARALWKRIPPRGREDNARPMNTASMLAGWRWGMTHLSVLREHTTRLTKEP